MRSHLICGGGRRARASGMGIATDGRRRICGMRDTLIYMACCKHGIA